MKRATSIALTTLLIAAVGVVESPAYADGLHTEQLNAQFMPSTRTRAEVQAEALVAARQRTLARYGDATVVGRPSRQVGVATVATPTMTPSPGSPQRR